MIKQRTKKNQTDFKTTIHPNASSLTRGASHMRPAKDLKRTEDNVQVGANQKNREWNILYYLEEGKKNDL